MSSITPEQIQSIRSYIKQTWVKLTRSHEHILDLARDSKLAHAQEECWFVYISPREECDLVQRRLTEKLSSTEIKHIQIRTLPIESDLISQHGILYLPGSYVVPGGRFNEMYGWDSYFILLGLLRDDELELAKSQVDQLLYEVQHYGTVLNANRTYMLSRSQPPILTQMVAAVFDRTQDESWLAHALPLLEQFYYYWVVPPHLNASTGLSRYFALGNGASPEVEFSECDETGKTHYDRVREYYQRFEVPDYDLNLFYDRDLDTLTELFYKGDRSMRESGFDISNRFGPFSVDIIHYAPVCLNSLLYQVEQDLAHFSEYLGHAELAHQWRDRATSRRDQINTLLWDEAQGLYLDYHLSSDCRRNYEFITTFYPLWLGIASESQARRVVENLERFEAPGGLRTSTHVTGNQWDAPFGWAPLTLIAVQGLYRYGFRNEGDRIAEKFLKMVIQEFERCGVIVEKYDVERCSAKVSDEIFFGYSSNEIGFGWTNGVVLELLHAQPHFTAQREPG